ncbi:putative lipoprotein YajG [Bradyrhizobium diazoefficiens]|uniref:hypothetical protein n=1 Tax=Bradyrhizobium diazoefficiens TaxID=1355477 RepID=UPI0035153BB1
MKSDIAKKYEITTNDGQVVTVEANFAFNNDGELVFRLGTKGDTEVVATFAKGHWASCIKVAQ